MTVVLTPEQIARYAYDAGFRGMALTRAVAVALAESGGRPGAHNDTPPDDSYGLWQINMLGGLGPERRHDFHLASNAALLDPAVNARAAYAISSHGSDWRPWSVFLHGAYRQHVPAARRAAQAVTARGTGGTGGSPGHVGRRIVLDLAELARLARLFQHSADRVEHTRRAVANLAADTKAARTRLPDPALATLIGTLLETADAPTQLRLAASRLDRQGEYAERVKLLAEQADGADGRWSAADARRFLLSLHSVGREVDPVERAVRETVLGGVIMRGHRVLGAFAESIGHRPAAPAVLPAAGVEGLTNGRVPLSQLSSVGDGARMTKAAAGQFRAMDAAAKAAGLDLCVNSGYRTYAEQAALYDRYLHHGGPLAAQPGHSTHGLGLSADIDVRDARVFAWLEHHADEYGFVRDVRSERWHWTYRPQ